MIFFPCASIHLKQKSGLKLLLIFNHLLKVFLTGNLLKTGVPAYSNLIFAQ